MRPCQEPGCARTHMARGLCATHYRQRWTRGAFASRISATVTSSELRPVPGYSDLFASTDGHVYSTAGRWSSKPHRLAEHPDKSGYLDVRVTVGGRLRTAGVHRLVTAAFLGPMPEGMQRRHLNGDKLDNRPENLAYGTAQDNADDKVRHGTTLRGLRNPKAVMDDRAVQEAIDLYATGRYTQRQLAAQLGCSQSAIASWVSGRKRSTRELVAKP